jgi:hypothetical protein
MTPTPWSKGGSKASGYALIFGRTTAVLTAAGVVAFLFADNAFLFPDLVLAVLLLAGALAPGRWAGLLLIVGFAYTAGVLGAASMTYVVDGAVGIGATSGFVGSIVALGVLLAARVKRRT